MNILLINHYAGSPRHGMEYRPYYLAREWVRDGHSVRIVAATFSHVRSTQPTGMRRGGSRRFEESIDGIQYHWYPTPAYSGNGVGRVRNILAFLRSVWTDARRIVDEFAPEVVIASSTYPMDIWVAMRVARLARAKLIFEVHDLWPLSPIEINGMSPWHPFIVLCRAAESAAYRHADAVVSMLPKVADYMSGRGLDLGRLHIVPNGISPEEWEQAPEPLDPAIAAFIDARRKAGCSIVGYAGSHGLPNALDTLVSAASIMRNEPVAFVLVGDGHERPRLLQMVAGAGLESLAMFPPIPKRQVPAFLRELDIAYIGWQRVSIYRFGIAPNKLMDYMMAGCPVLHSVDAGNDPVVESGCGLSVLPGDAEAVAAGLRKLAAMTAAQREQMGMHGREFVRRHHTYPVLARRFLQACGAADPPRSR